MELKMIFNLIITILKSKLATSQITRESYEAELLKINQQKEFMNKVGIKWKH